jgi:pyruvate dehydrogenase E2 component (dihydrolipoamide acetyltransferase)
MTQSSAVPTFQVQTDVAMDEALGLRAQLGSLESDTKAPSINDLVLRACALALRAYPRANGSYRDGQFELHSRINAGIAVAADEALVVPTIFDADEKSLGQIGNESRRLADRVRSGSITPDELAGATFTVSNLGMFGMTAISPILNVPQAVIVGVGAIRNELARQQEEIIDRSVLTLTLSCDHRIVYGAEAASYLWRVKELLEAPLNLVV